MGIVDLLNVPRLAEPQLSPDGRDVLFTRARRRTGRRANAITHIWRARVDGGQPLQLTQRRRRRERRRAGRRREDDRVHREARRRRVRADLPAADRRRRGASADDARQRGVRHRLDAGRRRRCTSRRPTPKTRRRQGARSARETTSTRYDENFKQTHLWKVAVASKAGARITERRLLGHRLTTCRTTGGRSPTTARRRRCSATATRAKCGWRMRTARAPRS